MEKLYFENEYCSLKFHKQSLRKAVRDYVIAFANDESDIELVITRTFDVFEQLMESLKGNKVSGRIVAEVEFNKINLINEDSELVRFHFASYQTESIHDAEEFYESHMGKIASRLDQFNYQGSNFLLRRIKHIHLQLNVFPLSSTDRIA